MKKYIQWVLGASVVLLGASALFFFNYSQHKAALENRQLKLKTTHNRAISKFSNSIDKFASVVAGMHAFINQAEEMPTAEVFQKFVNQQLKDIKYEDSLVVSFIDTTHTFQYVFTKNQIDPSKLKGRKVGAFRDQAELKRLNRLMTHDSLQLFYPLNLVEGWVGIPIIFRVHRNERTQGYIAPIINFKSIIQSIYEDDTKNNYVFRFSTDRGDFDREVFYDGAKIYNLERDKEYYKNFDVSDADFQYSEVNYYGQIIKIGTAYKFPFKQNIMLKRVLWGWLITFTLFIFAISWQITRYKRLNFELQKLNETKNKFFSIIGHDIKGPLQSIKGFLGILKYEKIEDPDLNKVIEDLGDATENTYNLLDNLLTWARSQTGALEFNATQFVLNDAIHEVIKQLQYVANSKNIVLKEEQSEKFEIKADSNMIKTVIRNLLSNAIKFTKNDGLGEVSIQLIQKSEEEVMIMIADNGIGMNDKTKEGIFELEKHTSMKGTSGEEGTGLGLILSKDYIERHNGSITVESEISKGATFTITLPIDSE